MTAAVLVHSDAELLQRANVGERDALEELFLRHRSLAYRVAYRLLGHEEDALDAVQEAFVKAITHLPTFEGVRLRHGSCVWSAMPPSTWRPRQRGHPRDDEHRGPSSPASIAEVEAERGIELDQGVATREDPELVMPASRRLPAPPTADLRLHVDAVDYHRGGRRGGHRSA
ncbi:MAG: sigma factor [Gemmataceae bacterium]